MRFGKKIEPLLPPAPVRRFRYPGRKPLLFVLKTGIAWDDLPADLGCGCGKTCRHYLGLWHQVGVWWKLHALVLAELNRADQIDWSRALIDASFCKAPDGGEDTGPNPTDRSKSGSKHHVLTDAQGIPLNATVTAANVNEVTQVLDVLVNKPAVGGKPGPKRELPDRLQGDTGYESMPLRVLLRWLGIARDHTRARRATTGAWQWPGQVSLVCRAHRCLAPFVRPTTASFGSPHGDSGVVPPSRLFLDLPEVLEFIVTHFFRTLLGISQVVPTLL